MTKEEMKKYLEAVDLVCINCIYTTDSACGSCLVRKSVDYHNRGKNIRENNHKKVCDILKKGELHGEVTAHEDGTVEVSIEWGDWKHEHGYLDYLMKENGFILVNEEVTEEDGSDCYSATHEYKQV